MTLIKDPNYSLEYTAGMVTFREELLINGEYYDSKITECKWRIYSHCSECTAQWTRSITLDSEYLPDFDSEQEALDYIREHINDIC